MELIYFEWSKYQNYVISFFDVSALFSWSQLIRLFTFYDFTVIMIRTYVYTWLVGWLIDCILFYVLFKSISSIWKRHHCQCMDFKLRYLLSFLAFEQGGFLLQCTCRNVFFGNYSIWDWPFTISWLRYVADN